MQQSSHCVLRREYRGQWVALPDVLQALRRPFPPETVRAHCWNHAIDISATDSRCRRGTLRCISQACDNAGKCALCAFTPSGLPLHSPSTPAMQPIKPSWRHSWQRRLEIYKHLTIKHIQATLDEHLAVKHGVIVRRLQAPSCSSKRDSQHSSTPTAQRHGVHCIMMDPSSLSEIHRRFVMGGRQDRQHHGASSSSTTIGAS